MVGLLLLCFGFSGCDKEESIPAYIHIPKTAGNSITSWLKQTATTKVTKRNQHATVQEVLEGNHSLGPMQMQDLGWKFCVVRNP